MKKTLSIISAVFALMLVVSCGKATPDPKPEEPQPQPQPQKIDWRETYNGDLLLALSGAYAKWQETNTIPTTIKWDGFTVFNVEYLRAGITLLLKIIDNPNTWADENLTYPSAACSISSRKGEPFLPREIKFGEFTSVLRSVYASMTGGKSIPNAIEVSSYENKMTTSALLKAILEAAACYDAHESLPETVDVWESSYITPTAHCEVNAAEVKTARDAAFAKYNVTDKSTVREKATAIFEYARTEWTWEDYNNTKKGAVGTIKAKSGNCCDLSNAICAMARLSGIPARYFHAQCKYSSGYIGHVISQLFVDGKWEFADASNDSNSFGTVVFTDYTGLHYYEELEF